MGFLKFLKRDKKQSLDDLDLPPEPPPIDDFEENVEEPPLPDFDKSEEEEPKHDVFPDPGDIPDLDSDVDVSDLDEDVPELPEEDHEDHQGPIPPISADASEEPELVETTPEPLPESHVETPEAIQEPSKPEELPQAPPIAPRPRLFGRRPEHHVPVHHPHHHLEHPMPKVFNRVVMAKGKLFVRTDKFKSILGDISIARSDLRKSDYSLMKLENLKSTKDRSFEKIKSSLQDVQKKLIFIDKTLFKGD